MDPVETLSKGVAGLNPIYLASQALGFLVLFLIVWCFAFKPINRMLTEREERVRKAIEDAEHQREEMERLRQDYEQRIAQIEAEARERIQQATQEARAAAEAIREEARAERERQLQRALEDIRREREKMLVEIRDTVADLTVRAAERIIERSLDRTAHHELINDIIEKELSGRRG